MSNHSDFDSCLKKKIAAEDSSASVKSTPPPASSKVPPTTPAADAKTQDSTTQDKEDTKEDLPPPTKLYTWYNDTKGSLSIVDAKTYRVMGVDGKRIAGDIIAKGLPDEAIRYLKARHPWDIDLAADDSTHTHPNYRTVAHNMPKDLPRCLFEVPSFFLHANSWDHVQLESKEPTTTTFLLLVVNFLLVDR